MFSPLVYLLFMLGCVAIWLDHEHTVINMIIDIIIDFLTDDPADVGPITDGDESYRGEVRSPTGRCQDPQLNNSNTKELLVDYRKQQGGVHNLICINRTAVEAGAFSDDLAWTHHTNNSTKTMALLPLQTEEAQGGLQDSLQLLQLLTFVCVNLHISLKQSVLTHGGKFRSRPPGL